MFSLWSERNACSVLVRQTEVKGLRGRPRRRWKRLLKLALKKMDDYTRTEVVSFVTGTGGGLI